MNGKLLTVFSGAVLAANATPAVASTCIEPRAPSALFMRKPSKLYCAQSRSCSEWEVGSYKADVRRYYQELEEYASSANAFRKQAAEYIECMADLD